MNVKVGADPELFVKKNEEFYSAYKLVPGNKKAPFLVNDGAVQVDGMALEFNITPSEDKNTFVHNINSVLSQLREMVPKEYDFSKHPTVHFPSEYMEEQPMEALLLGCEQDYNAYSRSPAHYRGMGDIRTAGGHVHIGWTEEADPLETSHFLSCCQLTIQLDYFLGLPSLFLDDDSERRKYYGAAGTFRPKPYGLEYRVLSNFWIFDDRYIELVFTQTQRAFNYLVNEGRDFYKIYRGNASQYINYSDINKASDLFNASNGILIEGYEELLGEGEGGVDEE